MRHAVVAFMLVAAPPFGVAAQTVSSPTTVPPGVLDMPASDQTSLMLRAVKGPAPEERAAGTLLDWYPVQGGFRVTGGFREADDARRGGFAPYLGFGWQGALVGDKVLVGLDFGALYQGRPDVRLVDAGPDAGIAPDDELVRRALSPLPFEPVFSLTFTYRF